MNIWFPQPLLISLVALVGVPILIHLYARARPPVFHFSSVEFLQRILRQTRRIRRPQDLLLLILRSLLFLLLILMFLQPVLQHAGAESGLGVQRTVIVIVDASASMAYLEGAQSRFTAACAEAAEVLQGMRSGDRSNLIWLRSPPVPVFSEPGVNVTYLRDELRKGQITKEPADWRSALRMAVEMLRDQEGRRELCLVSDFQASNWEEAQDEIPSDIVTMIVPVGEEPGENVALTRLFWTPTVPLASEPVTLFCDVENFSDVPQEKSIVLRAGSRREERRVLIPAWEKATVAFSLASDAPGWMPVSVHSEADSFPFDNDRYAAIHVVGRLRIGIYPGEPETAGYWERALQAIDWAQPELFQLDGALLSDRYDLLMLSGWNGEKPDEVLAALRRDIPTIWYPAAGTPLKAAEFLLGQDWGMDAGGMTWEQPRKTLHLEAGEGFEEVFGIFRGGNAGDPTRGTFLGRLAFEIPSDAEAVSVLQYTDGQPALARFAARPLTLWNLPLQSTFSDWAGRIEFLPILGELLLSSRVSQSGSASVRSTVPGASLKRSLPGTLLAEDLVVESDQGGRHSVARREAEHETWFATEPVSEPGLYTWKNNDEPFAFTAVNFPPVESDLRRAPNPEQAAKDAKVLRQGRHAEVVREGIKMWPWFLVAALGVVLIEGAVAWWGGRG